MKFKDIFAMGISEAACTPGRGLGPDRLAFPITRGQEGLEVGIALAALAAARVPHRG